MPAGAPPDRAPHDLDVSRADLPEGGFGWRMIRDLTEELLYRRQDGRNILELVMLLEGADPSADPGGMGRPGG